MGHCLVQRPAAGVGSFSRMGDQSISILAGLLCLLPILPTCRVRTLPCRVPPILYHTGCTAWR